MFLDSDRVAPLRSKTRGYTGTLRQCYPPPKIEAAFIKELQIRLRTLSLDEVDAYEWTQLVRGQAFVMMDWLLTSYDPKEGNDAKEQTKPIIDYCQTYFDVYKSWVGHLHALDSMVIFNVDV